MTQITQRRDPHSPCFGVLLAVLAIALPGLALPSAAGPIVLQPETGVEGLYDPAEGWIPVSEGVWERHTADGRFERFAHGPEGLRAVAEELRTELLALLDTYLQNPTEPLGQVVHSRLKLLRAIERDILRAEAGAAASTGACQRTFSFGADAQTIQCTSQASANASYSTDNPSACPEQCTVVAEATVTRDTCDFGLITDQESCSLTGTNVSCQAHAELSDFPNVTGSSTSPCSSRAFASIHCPGLGLLQSQEDTSDRCNQGRSPCIAC